MTINDKINLHNLARETYKKDYCRLKEIEKKKIKQIKGEKMSNIDNKTLSKIQCPECRAINWITQKKDWSFVNFGCWKCEGNITIEK
jgi:hypothetical protein